jgi:hypothetical protein
VQQEAFSAVLEGVERGAYDMQIVNWLTGWDDPTCRTIASLMWRCRLARGGGRQEGHDDRYDAKARIRARTEARTMGAGGPGQLRVANATILA